MIELRGPRVRLRPFLRDELDLLWAERQADDSFPHLTRPGALERLRRQVERSGRFVDGRLDVAIEGADGLAGHLEARAPRGAMPGGVFEIGISVFPAARGRGYGGEAVELLTGYLLGEGRGYRVQASTAVANEPMRRVLEKVGYSFEGVLRGFMPAIDGGREDYALYAVTRPDWEARLRPSE